MRKVLAVLAMLLCSSALLLCSSAPALAQVSIGVGVPGISIGINLPVYPQLVRVPGYPVYYAPGVNSNYFFYDGMYWVFDQDNWYASTWYNGPWQLVYPDEVPLYVLRVPVRYYRAQPVYFRGWAPNAPPRWGDRWGNRWAQQHRGWDRWNRNAAPAPAPLPTYQRQFSGNRYPRADEQRTLQNRNYRYQPRDRVAQQQFQSQPASRPAPSRDRAGTRDGNARPPGEGRSVQRAVPPAPVQRAPRGEQPPGAGDRGPRGPQAQGARERGPQAQGRPEGRGPPQGRGESNKGGDSGRGKGGERGND